MTPQQLMKRQCDYDRLLAHFGRGDPSYEYRQSSSAFDLHKHVVRILDGLEPWPIGCPQTADGDRK